MSMAASVNIELKDGIKFFEVAEFIANKYGIQSNEERGMHVAKGDGDFEEKRVPMGQSNFIRKYFKDAKELASLTFSFSGIGLSLIWSPESTVIVDVLAPSELANSHGLIDFTQITPLVEEISVMFAGKPPNVSYIQY